MHPQQYFVSSAVTVIAWSYCACAIMSIVLSYRQSFYFCQLHKCSVHCGQFIIWMLL